ncbi:C6 transcription factor, putative [Trichophyton benhamiae CBS 112371]|uniref:C6 transcription factor, putative n=1 Tax=Arthroderma benhamiae (strain ATCC MYA-4681 / CBS 112371) TaxID=663331 RepID=D4AYB6_ARTBC|nr:C6 transcription factor, putative [Trichophyton benhamiae CBS 112371]EFE31932.1 C6 transcription factor, putative [Trichophyton benhamiae CBS 112371]
MLFTQRAPAFDVCRQSLNINLGRHVSNVRSEPSKDSNNYNHTSETGSGLGGGRNRSSCCEVADADSNGSSSRATSDSTTPSPTNSTANESFSRLSLEAPDDIPRGSPGPWTYTSTAEQIFSTRVFSTDRNTSDTDSPMQVSQSLSFTVISSPASAMHEEDVVPKIEEIEDEEDGTVPLSLHHGEPQDGKSDVPPSPTACVPRKRGRPRKHPPPVPGQAKVTKGRSKTGCITCRRRKKKCDETKPACLNCQKNAVVCEGYPVKEVWKSGKQKIEEAARRHSFAIFARGLPVLIDGIETDIDRRFLDHFVNDFSRVLTLINDDSNPFKEILLPMATQHKGLMHSLMCLAGSHLSARDPEPMLKERKHYHFHRAITNLRNTIAAQSSACSPSPSSTTTSTTTTETSPETRTKESRESLPVEDPMIASTIALCLHTICEGETKGEYRSHMDAARYLLMTQRPRNEKFRQFIVEFFQYHDVSNSVTTLDRRPICFAGDLRLPDFVPHAQAGALLGIFDGLFHYISEITVLRDRIRQRINQGIEPAIDYQTLSEAVGIDSQIRAWEPSYPADNPNWLASQLYRQSTWVYLYRTIRPSRPDEKISQVVDDGLLYLNQLPLDSGAYSILLMPLFLLGCSAFEPYQRERIKTGFDSVQAYSSLRNIDAALRVVEKVWDVMDTSPNLSWDWEKIIDDMNMDFLIT